MNKPEINQKTGFIPTPTTHTDYLAGVFSAITYQEILPDGDWTPYLPSDEFQNGGLETMACVSFAATNSVEMQLNRLLKEIPDDILSELKEYITEGKFNFSDRALAKMSNTTPSGNTLPNVWSAIRHYGLLPEKDWPSVWTTWAVYYQGIPQSFKDKALKFLQYFDVQYEYINNGSMLTLDSAKKHLKQAPIQIATAICSGWNVAEAPVIEACDLAISHSTTNYNADNIYYIEDSYLPYQKKLSGYYRIPYAMKGLIIPKFNLKKNDMPTKLVRKKNTEQVFIVLNGKRYWVKDLENFEDLQKSQPVTISWEQVEIVDTFFEPYGGEIIGKANLADALKVLFGSVK